MTHRIPARAGRAGAFCALLLALAACGGRIEPEDVPAPVREAADAVEDAAEEVARAVDPPGEPVQRQIPYEGAFGPAEAPLEPVPPGKRPLQDWVVGALNVWWQRPSPEGPPPIPVAQPKAISITGKGPIIQVLPGPPAFPDRIPEYLKTFLPAEVPFSNNVKRLPRGEFRAVAFDRTLNDSKLSRDSMAVRISFTDAEGAEWRIEQVNLAPLSINPIAEPWFGGVVIDTLYHGHEGAGGTPAEPLLRCKLCSWGWADIYKDGQRVASSADLHVMLSSKVRAGPEKNFAYQCYDCRDQPVQEVHVVVGPNEYLPSPGGFLHVMWEDSDWQEGAPAEIVRNAPQLAEEMPTIRLSAVPYLKWDKQEIRVRTGQRYRLIVENNDPSSFHMFRLHPEPHAGGGHAEELRHDESGFAGGIGPLWKPGDEAHHGHGEPPAPRAVFFALPQGSSSWATVVQFDKPGEYPFMCPVANHKMRGMMGKFIVEGPARAEAGAKPAAAIQTGGAR